MTGPLLGIIDRRIEVLEGCPEQKASIRRVSDLRELPFVVLLGEPGIGKSTVLAAEAKREEVCVIRVRELVRGASSHSDTLFLDALDEYRADGHPSEKAYGVAQAVTLLKAKRWRLTCRSEDWRKEADIAEIEATTSGEPIVVAQILPLDSHEASLVLCSLGESDPGEFLDKAETLGARAFVENPLSLKLLHNAVSDGGEWPKSRFELFETAVQRLGYERDRLRSRIARSSPSEIMRAAAWASLLLLVSGARAIWRSNDEPPGAGKDSRLYVTASDLSLNEKLLRDTLDTALFRGEGEAFEPMHRTVAEFLSGRALATIVKGGPEVAALPLSRALSLITGLGGKPPTEMRGVYAWFAAHLAQAGDNPSALRLVRADPVTVMTYGDAAAFGPEARRELLASLALDDPYFRASEVGVTALGSLVGQDLSEDIIGILTAPPDGTHRLVTVLDALVTGRPISSVRQVLREIATDPFRPGWIRWRAADAWLNGVSSVPHARRELFDAVESESVSESRLALRLHLVDDEMSPAVSAIEIRSIISEHTAVSKDSVIGSLFALQQLLHAEPYPELLDAPVREWLPVARNSGYDPEVRRVLDVALAGSIRTVDQLHGARLWGWIKNSREHEWSGIGDDAREALSHWLDTREGGDVELFEAMQAEDDPSDGHWVVPNKYTHVTSRHPSSAIVRFILAKAKEAEHPERLLKMAASVATHTDVETYWEVHRSLRQAPGCEDAALRMERTEVPQGYFERYERGLKRDREQEERRALSVSKLLPIVSQIACAEKLGVLEWAARAYFEGKGTADAYGLERVTEKTNAAIAAAVDQGWRQLVASGLSGADAAMLGRLAAKGRQHVAVVPAVAAFDRLCEIGDAQEMQGFPLVAAIAVLSTSWVVPDQVRRKQIDELAIKRLASDADAASAALLDYWSEMLNGQSRSVPGLSSLSDSKVGLDILRGALEPLLISRPDMSKDALISALVTAARLIPRARLHEIAVLALGHAGAKGSVRSVWTYVSAATAPAGSTLALVPSCAPKAALRMFDQVGRDLLHSFDADEEGRIRREKLTIASLGALVPPSMEARGGWVSPRMRREMIVRSAIKFLAGSSNAAATPALAELIQNSQLPLWRTQVQHAQAQHVRLMRDKAFVHPRPSAIRSSVQGGAPVNASDLRAVVLEELRRLQEELHESDNTPWKNYWNTDKRGWVTEPRIENQCRNQLLDRLRDRMSKYGVAAAIPEAQRREETRADILVMSGAGRNLPIELKRHFHSELWTAASTQLQQYAADPGADGMGIYVVFWFGADVAKTPVREDGGERPVSAKALQNQLVHDLPEHLAGSTDVVVLDVSEPMRKGKPRKE